MLQEYRCLLGIYNAYCCLTTTVVTLMHLTVTWTVLVLFYCGFYVFKWSPRNISEDRTASVFGSHYLHTSPVPSSLPWLWLVRLCKIGIFNSASVTSDLGLCILLCWVWGFHHVGSDCCVGYGSILKAEAMNVCTYLWKYVVALLRKVRYEWIVLCLY
jgi:hypothetical protein